MNLKRIAVVGLAAGVLSAGLVAAPAQAIVRDVCNFNNVQVISIATTCWAWAGTTSRVTLYNVSFVQAGINSGWVMRYDGKLVTFNRNFVEVPSRSLFSYDTVEYVHIN